MIITAIRGGLGNQMFQYALGRVLSLRNNDTLKLDITAFEHTKEGVNEYSIRQFDLGDFSIVQNIASKEEIRTLKYPLGILSKYIRGIRGRLFKAANVKFDPRILQKKGNIYLDGYWQSERYFMEYSSVIREDFSPKSSLSQQATKMVGLISSEATPVSLHIRRGDNAHNADSMKRFGMPSTTYYENAPLEIARRLGASNLHMFIFSDDIPWVKENIKLPFPVTYVSQNGIADWEEIILMSKCKHHIIANSTFSWWGAWLNSAPDKIVVAPTHWANLNKEAFVDIIPKGWIRM